MLGLLKRLIVTHNMIANYGYMDGSGEFYVVLDTDKCTGCGKCVPACPAHALEDYVDDYDQKIMKLVEAHAHTLKYDCGQCNPVGAPKNAKCEQACAPGAINVIFKLKGK